MAVLIVAQAFGAPPGLGEQLTVAAMPRPPTPTGTRPGAHPPAETVMSDPRGPEQFGEYRDYLMALARVQVSVDLRARIDPSDLVQETLCEALRDLPHHRGRSRAEMMGWLRSLLRFNLIDRLRRLRLERR